MTQSKWTEAEIDLIVARFPKEGADRLAQEFGRTAKSVRQKAYRLKLRGPESWSKADLAYLTKHYPSHGARHVAEKLGRTAETVRQRASLLGVRCEITKNLRSDGVRAVMAKAKPEAPAHDVEKRLADLRAAPVEEKRMIIAMLTPAEKGMMIAMLEGMR